MLKNFFKQNVLNNQKGSTLTITIVVIAVLAFSITSITKMTVNLSGSTTAVVNNVNDESLAKGRITQAIFEFEEYISAGNSFTDFNQSEITRINDKLNVDVFDLTDDFADFGEANGKLTKVYKFSYALINNHSIYKYAYMSDAGSGVGTYHPFDFSLGTEGDLVLNGGYYDGVRMFGENVYLTNVAPWEEDLLDFLPDSHHLTSGNVGTYPDFTNSITEEVSEIFYGNEYQYCTTNCFNVTEDGSNPYIINKTLSYNDVIGSSLADKGDVQADNITSFFNEFSFENYVVNIASRVIPTDTKRITDTMNLENFEDVIRDNMGVITYRNNGGGQGGGWGYGRITYPNTPYVNITSDDKFDFNDDGLIINVGAVYDCDEAGVDELIIWDDLQFSDWDGEGLIVLGDLKINNYDYSDEIYRGTYIVTGDLTITGQRIDFREATFIVFGETKIDMDYGYGIYTLDDEYELSIFSQDNIRLESNWENYYNSEPSLMTALLYTEESVFINAVSSKINLQGAIFARATGNSDNPIPMKDDSNKQINGIVINSYRGYVDRDYEQVSGVWQKDLDYIPRSYETANRFLLEAVPESDYADSFFNIPDYENVQISEGEYTLETSEWKIE